MEAIGQADITLLIADRPHCFFEELESGPVFRSFPNGQLFTNDVANLLLDILKKGYVPFNRRNTTIEMCYEMGWVHRVAGEKNEDIVVLPSHLHEW